MSRNAVKRARPLTGSLPLAIVCHALVSWPRNRGYGQLPQRENCSAFTRPGKPGLLLAPEIG